MESKANVAKDAENYLVWSNQHGCWWRADQAGYTIYIAAAGRYSRSEALGICAQRDGADDGTVLPEVPVLERDAQAFVTNKKAPDHE